MKGQIIEKYQQQKNSIWCVKSDKESRNYIISVLCGKMPNKSQENWICENELLLTLNDKLKPNATESPFFYYNS